MTMHTQQIFTSLIKSTLILSLLFSSSIALSGCFKSDLKKCIDKQSYLWDNTQNPAHKNKAYWDAVAACKEKYR
ncbi:hypothetical protein [Thiomicrorhabdus sediminis]|uniref:Uncharacterized protein n=1 Tax=Thiomicrorhabdus sediminis TaxID=2580412 RepID=A0A4P9K4K7_9GAMM|nr:hypothetical protein [Thiomicrorhabdus sediminis]QCU89848.1 hypothetical protein FE785_03925 [Thiomicrorhabdus sediminis]